jgi:hypothetical protein
MSKKINKNVVNIQYLKVLKKTIYFINKYSHTTCE